MRLRLRHLTCASHATRLALPPRAVYDEGDATMKKTIAEAFMKNRSGADSGGAGGYGGAGAGGGFGGSMGEDDF